MMAEKSKLVNNVHTSSGGILQSGQLEGDSWRQYRGPS